MERLGRDRASSRLELYGVIGAASLQAVPTPLFDPEAGLANADRALALAEASGDVAGQAKAHWLRMLVETRHNSRAAVAAGLASLELARRYGLREQEAFTLNDIQSNYQVLGQPEAALRALDEARPIWESLDNLPMLADNLASAAMLYSLLAEYDAAFERARQSLAVSDRTGNLWGQSYARIAIGVSHFARGDLGEAIRQLTLCVELAERAGFLYPQVAMQSLLAIAYGQAGELRRAEARARRVREVEQANPFPGQVSGKATLGWVAVQRGELEAAERWLQGLDIAITSQSISMLDSPVPLAMADSAFHLARRDFARALESIDSFSATFESFAWRVIRAPLLLARGRALAGLGRPAEARQVFETARVEMAAKGFEAGLWEVEAELAALHHAAGDPLPASELSRSAAAHLTAVADGLSDLGLKESFLAQPRVRSILELAASLAP
jgi:tetratricopeptide (TPR) repeat protein